MSYRDFEEFKKIYIPRTPKNELHTAVSSDVNVVKQEINKMESKSTDLFAEFGGIRACRKEGTHFYIKHSDGKIGDWDSESNTWDYSKDIQLPDEEWQKEP